MSFISRPKSLTVYYGKRGVCTLRDASSCFIPTGSGMYLSGNDEDTLIMHEYHDITPR